MTKAVKTYWSVTSVVAECFHSHSYSALSLSSVGDFRVAKPTCRFQPLRRNVEIQTHRITGEKRNAIKRKVGHCIIPYRCMWSFFEALDAPRACPRNTWNNVLKPSNIHQLSVAYQNLKNSGRKEYTLPFIHHYWLQVCKTCFCLRKWKRTRRTEESCYGLVILLLFLTLQGWA